MDLHLLKSAAINTTLIQEVRRGRLEAREGSPLSITAFHRDII
jgi:hypothetical protein